MSFLEKLKIKAGLVGGPGVYSHIVPATASVCPVPMNDKPYTMAKDGEDGEITMYGEIVDSRPYDWWTGEAIEGDYIVQREFLADLEALAGVKTLTLRMSSIGGDAGVSILIHNRLRELATNGTKLTCIVDGVAMSGGSLIMCACDDVQVNPSSLIMIHKCWGILRGGYNADALREQAAAYDAWDKAQVSIYRRKCGLPDRTILNMMANTTYMTGAEAVEKGFADTVLENAEPLDIAASADRCSLFVRGRQLRLAPGMLAPDGIPMVNPEASAPVAINTPKPAQTGRQNGGNTMANTLEELHKENPALAEQLMAEAKAAVSASGAVTPLATPPASAPVSAGTMGAAEASPAAEAPADPVAAERQRMQDIDALAGIFDTETINAAKYGDTACTAQEMVYRAAQKSAKQGSKFLAALEGDADASGAQQVGAATSTSGGGTDADENLTPQQLMAKGRADAKTLTNPEKEEK